MVDLITTTSVGQSANLVGVENHVNPVNAIKPMLMNKKVGLF